ncbi:DeoR/GlpR family DNA-binding transcription regulator [Oceanobacillus sp. FSL W8-0428]|uniref:DeoR family transcriptional regulator n=1 Tax=Oceanobacillus sojae TaxID=582851 RepID=A0A511ZR34_9BACI|nr:DeoR/GlpR family DNA-binding transcription regulator [Oceanobacillus sojae]MCT1904827.1 DeoR/GlpR family DNA-binding transcription regulator [Oceanobacillus sojae]GEN89911.1 DeoR family transcriptional regulator [Oceanobacillus sojae]
MKMFVTERRNKIMELLHDKQRLTVKELSEQIGVSEATLRTDLNKMEKDGLLTRTHGGAMLTQQNQPDFDTSFSVREKQNRKEKSLIAKEAFHLIEEKQCILLDASSTALELARYLNQKMIRLTVVTSGIQTALELKDNPNITVILIGGVVTKGSSTIEGTLGVELLDKLHIDILFTSANGFSVENGLTDFNLYEVELKKQMVNRAQKIVAVIDHSKIGITSSAPFASTEQVDVLITNNAIDPDIEQVLAKHNIQVVSAL